MTKRETSPDLYVLDTMANDVEDLAAIMRTLNSDTAAGWHRAWGRQFERQEVIASLSRLVTSDLARASMLAPDGKSLVELQAKQLPPGSYDDAWFAMTPHGRMLHANWNPDMSAAE
jgi:hypothetical protein